VNVHTLVDTTSRVYNLYVSHPAYTSSGGNFRQVTISSKLSH
jgi:hypothetical protein